MSQLRKRRPSRRRFPTLLLVFVFVLGPLTIAAYACENAAVGSDAGSESAGTATPPASSPEPEAAATDTSSSTPAPVETSTPEPQAQVPEPESPQADTSTTTTTTTPEPTTPEPTEPDPAPDTDPDTDPGTEPGGSGSGGTSATGATGGSSNPSAGGGAGSPAGGSTAGTGATGAAGKGADTTPPPVQSQATPIPSGIVEPEDPDGSTSEGKLKVKPSSNSANAAANDVAGASTVSQASTTVASDEGGSGDSGSSSRSRGSDSGAEKEAPAEAQRRTTIARAVDSIPLSFRIALLVLIFSTSVLAVVSWRERRRATAVAKVAQLDHLTGLANREGFDRHMAIEWQRAIRYGTPLGLVFVDLDHFKSFNDTNGHVAGDRLLREVAAAITATARGSDFTARLGGDEFVVLCPETDDDGLERLVERLRIEAAGMAVSLSIGFAAKHDEDAAPEDLVHRADAAMYAAKGGRRRGTRAAANPMLGSMRRG